MQEISEAVVARWRFDDEACWTLRQAGLMRQSTTALGLALLSLFVAHGQRYRPVQTVVDHPRYR